VTDRDRIERYVLGTSQRPTPNTAPRISRPRSAAEAAPIYVPATATTISALAIRRSLGPKHWGVPERFGPDGWRLLSRVDRSSIIVTAFDWDDAEWVHASISHADRLPTYDELVALHRAVWGNGYAYQQFVPPGQHVDHHEYALHLWGKADGSPVLPAFTGSI
jgi:hypothetical protein